jgi:hypothetical protein
MAVSECGTLATKRSMARMASLTRKTAAPSAPEYADDLGADSAVSRLRALHNMVQMTNI